MDYEKHLKILYDLSKRYSKLNSYILTLIVALFFYPLNLNPNDHRNDITIIFSNDIRGKLEPCGCDLASSFGGLDRRQKIIKERFSDNTIFVDAGNMFFEYPEDWGENPGLDFKTQESAIKAFTLIQFFADYQHSLTAVNVGHTDLSLGLKFVKNSGLPFVSANIVSSKNNPMFPSFIEKHDIQFWGITRPVKMKKEKYSFLPIKTVLKRIEEYKTARKILLTDLKAEDLKKVAGKFDLVIWSRINDPEVKNVQSGNIASAKMQGRDLGIVKITGGEIDFDNIHFLPLSSEIQSDYGAHNLINRAISEIGKLNSEGIFNYSLAKVLKNENADFYQDIVENILFYLDTIFTASQKKNLQDYSQFASFERLLKVDQNIKLSLKKISQNKHVLELINDILLPPKTYSDFQFASSLACQRCHLKEYSLWTETKHSNTFQTLENKGQEIFEHAERERLEQREIDPSLQSDCIVCHTTGYRQAGGPSRPRDILQVHSLVDVGCESCHGKGKEHIINPYNFKLKTIKPIDTCKTCHKLEHSSKFSNDWIHAVSCKRDSSEAKTILYTTCATCHALPEKWNANENTGLLDYASKHQVIPMKKIAYEEFKNMLKNGKGNMPAFDEIAGDEKLTRDLYKEIIEFWGMN